MDERIVVLPTKRTLNSARSFNNSPAFNTCEELETRRRQPELVPGPV
jgi:hypothetical protein